MKSAWTLPLLVCLWAAGAHAQAWTSGAAAQDGLFTQAATSPAPGAVRLSTGADAALLGDRGGGPTQVSTSALWSIGGGLAAGISTSYEGGRLAPALSMRYQLFSQERAPVSLATSVRLRSVGFEAAGSELDVRLAVGRTFGALELTANAAVGRGLGLRGDVDVELSSLSTVALTPWLRAGLEARLHAELVDAFKTEEDTGRPYGLTAGPVVAVRWDAVWLQALAGWNSPRGMGRAGLLAMGLASVEF